MGLDPDPWKEVDRAAQEATYPSEAELEVLERNLGRLGTPYAYCPVCRSRQEIDFSLDGSRTPYCCECGEYENLGKVSWKDAEPEPLTQQERRVLAKILDVYYEGLETSQTSAETKDALRRLVDSIYDKLIIPYILTQRAQNGDQRR